MFENLTPATPDAILSVMRQSREDARPQKIDLSVGVYKDEKGETPIMAAVRLAQARLHAQQTTKTYVGPLGDPGFNAAMTDLVWGPSVAPARLGIAQTPGGSGALRMLANLIFEANPTATVFVPDPTWANHIPLFSSAGLALKSYAYYDPTGGGLRFDAMLQDLRKAKPGDVLLLHGCCHNPTGADLAPAQWAAIGALCGERGLTPLVDLAYQGLGGGIDADAAGLRYLADLAPEMMVAASASKNFALYRERVGAALVLSRDRAQAALVSGKLGAIARGLWSMPPDHGAALVRLVLEDAELRAQWRQELEVMRRRIENLRRELTQALNAQTRSNRFDAIARQSGMFSRLELGIGQAQRLKDRFAIYVLSDGRINVAGLTREKIAAFAHAYAQTLV